MNHSTTLGWYGERGYRLVPSLIDNHKITPRGWRDTEYTISQLELGLTRGGGVVWALSDSDLVIDVDLYKPHTSRDFTKLNQWFGGSISAVAPTVHTPRGGRHYYFRVPADVNLASSIPELGASVEFKSVGTHVTCPPTPGYSFDYASPHTHKAPQAPLWLVSRLTITAPDNMPGCPYWSSDVLRAALGELDVTEYGSNGSWWQILCSSHYATGGSGLPVFLEWSLGDPAYSHDGGAISNRWQSLTVQSKPNYITHLTLIKSILKRRGMLPHAVQTAVDTSDMIIPDGDAEQSQPRATVPTASLAPSSLMPRDTVRPTLADSPANAAPPADAPRSIEDLEREVQLLSSTTPTATIMGCMERVARLDEMQRIRLAALIANRTGIPRGDVRRFISQMASRRWAAGADIGKRTRDESEETGASSPVPVDLGQYLAEIVLKEHYFDGQHLLFAPERRYWSYTGTHWETRSEEAVDGDIHTAAMRLRNDLSAAASCTVAALMAQAKVIVKSISAKKGASFFNRADPPSVVNCRNGELWVDEMTGIGEIREHNPKSGLRACLPIDYEPLAVCPNWDNAIYGMFAPLSDPWSVARHLHDMLGYTLQPYKNHAAWVLLYGKGRNGKSTVLEVLSALLGDTGVLSVGLGDFSGQPHIFDAAANCMAVIEDDLRKGSTLPDDVLKKLSERKKISANPKHKSSYTYTNTATVWVSANHWPHTSDMSEGMRRRPYVFEFRRNFKTDGTEKHHLKKQIVDTELPGVLNRCLQGLIRVREGGGLTRPRDCAESRNSWLDSSNQVKRFWGDKVTVSDGYVPVSTFYEVYKLWCDVEGVRNTYSRSGMVHELASMGVDVITVDRVKHVSGVTIRADW